MLLLLTTNDLLTATNSNSSCVSFLRYRVAPVQNSGENEVSQHICRTVGETKFDADQVSHDIRRSRFFLFPGKSFQPNNGLCRLVYVVEYLLAETKLGFSQLQCTEVKIISQC